MTIAQETNFGRDSGARGSVGVAGGRGTLRARRLRPRIVGTGYIGDIRGNVGRPSRVYLLMKTVPELAAPTVPAPGGEDHGRTTPSATAERRSTTRGPAGAVAVAVVVAGVVTAVDPAGLRPYTTLRWAVVGVATATVAAAVRWRPPRPVAVLGAALLCWLVLATATAHDPLTALVGHPRRHFGLAGWVVCALALLAGTGLRGRDRRRLLGRTVALAAGVTGAAAVADLLGWDPFGTRFAGGRVGGLLGQPLYLAVTALLVGAVAVGVAADRSEGWGWRVVGAAGAAGAVVALGASQTRGAWLGALVAIGLVAVRRGRGRGSRREAAVESAGGRREAAVETAGERGPGPAGPGDPRAGSAARPRRRRRWGRRRRWPDRDPGIGSAGRRGRALTAAGLALAALGAVLTVTGPRLADLADRDAAGGIGRLDEWRVAVRVVADDPITGVGPDGYRIAAPVHIDDDYTRRHGRDEVVDRAHSAPLDVAATAGVPAALLFVGLVGVLLVRCSRVISRSPDTVLVAAAAAVVAWSVQMLVGFPIAEVDPLAWLLAGMVVAATSARPTRPHGSDGHGRTNGRRVVDAGESSGGDVAAGLGERDAGGPWVGRVVAGVVACVLGVGGATAVRADRALARAEEARQQGDIAAALAEADRATDLRPDDIDAWYLATRLAATPDGLPALDNGLDRIEAALDRLPGDPALRHLHTALLVERAQRTGLAADVASAERSARALVADDPSSPAAHRALGLAEATRGDEDAARAALTRALALAPDDDGARAALEALDDVEATG